MLAAAALALAACRPAAAPQPSSVAPDEGPSAASAEPAEPAPEVPSQPAWAREAAERITTHARAKTPRAWERLAFVADTFGHRLSGSKALEDTIDWAVTAMAEDGLENARREPVKVPHWVRGKESAKLVSPVRRDLVMLGLGGSVGTRGTLRGEVAVVDHVDEIAKEGERLKGKIVLIHQVMPPYDHEARNAFYGETVQARSRGAAEAAKVGAKAVLIRSVTAHSLRNPHTGALRYEDGVTKIPAAALAVEDAEMLARMARRGPVRVELKMSARTLRDADSANVVGELPGRELRDEIVLLGCHIDSWDVGDGSTDDMGGCVAIMEAARMLRELELTPRRTIRVVLFTNEENGLRGAKAYYDKHGKEHHVAAIESDMGQAAPLGFSVAGSDEQVAALARFSELFVDIGAATIFPGGGGADISPLMRDGVLGLGLRPDGSHYFDLHHSPADTVDKIDPDHLQRNAAAVALMAYILAERELPEAGPTPAGAAGAGSR